MASTLATATDAQQSRDRHGLSQHREFENPACPMDCDACKTWSCIGQRRLNNHDHTFTAVIGIGSLGGGFTFTVIFSTLDDRNGTLTPEVIDQARHFLVVAWVLFILAVTGASTLAFYYRVQARVLIERFDEFEPMTNILVLSLLDSLQLLILGAFFMSARALKPYDNNTARAVIILILLAGGSLILIWLSAVL